jgi:1-acyl-sn-glycerol-3-phosphate acyltransferase
MIRRLLANLIGLCVVGLARALTGVLPNWRGCLPGPRQRVYFANHTSHGDAALIWTVLPAVLRRRTRPVAALDYWKGGLRSFIGHDVFDAVLVDRQGRSCGQDPVNVLLSALDSGSSLILFPEGTRNTTGEPLLAFRSGLYRLAQARSDIELVPVWIDNIARVMPKGEFLPVPLLCSVTFGAPIGLGDGEDKESFLARARHCLLDLKPAEPSP